MPSHTIHDELEAIRQDECRPLTRDPDEPPFFCSLGTMWCTEAHSAGPLAWQGADEWRSREEGR